VLHKYTHILNSTTVLSNTTGRHIQQAKWSSDPSSSLQF
jgi:hypothetical protein